MEVAGREWRERVGSGGSRYGVEGAGREWRERVGIGGSG